MVPSNKELVELIKLNLERVDRILSTIDFTKVGVTSQLADDVKNFFYDSAQAIAKAKVEHHVNVSS